MMFQDPLVRKAAQGSLEHLVLWDLQDHQGSQEKQVPPVFQVPKVKWVLWDLQALQDPWEFLEGVVFLVLKVMMALRVSQGFLALQEKKVVKVSLAFQVLLDQWIQIFQYQKERRGTLDYLVSLEFLGQKVILAYLEIQDNLD